MISTSSWARYETSLVNEAECDKNVSIYNLLHFPYEGRAIKISTRLDLLLFNIAIYYNLNICSVESTLRLDE